MGFIDSFVRRVVRGVVREETNKIDNKVSSTCEMVTNLIEYYDVEIDSYYATILLSGIVLDTVVGSFFISINSLLEVSIIAPIEKAICASASRLLLIGKYPLITLFCN